MYCVDTLHHVIPTFKSQSSWRRLLQNVDFSFALAAVLADLIILSNWSSELVQPVKPVMVTSTIHPTSHLLHSVVMVGYSPQSCIISGGWGFDMG